jgi:UPF0755 protein
MRNRGGACVAFSCIATSTGGDWQVAGKDKAKPSKARRWLFSLVTSLMLTSLVVIGYILFQLQAPAEGAVVTLNIANGDTPREIAGKLEQQGFVRDARIFWLYLLLNNEGDQFKAGQYTLKIGSDRDELIRTLNGGGEPMIKSVRLTIPEGFTVRQLANRVEQKFAIPAEQFIEEAEGFVMNQSLAASTGTASFPWFSEIPKDEELLYPLEGYLFPDTYEFKENISAAEMIQELLAQTNARLAQLPAGWEQQLQKLGISVHEMLTIASLIEREVVVPEERKIVASVIYNRLNKGMPLQIDATVQYLLPAQKDRLLYADLEVNSPYNTYRSNGLPPGPIANPGLAAIEAACFPGTSDYFFYVTKKDGTNGHLFARTFAEHKQNIAKSKQ